ncbi:MAG: hypothetical protein Q8L38_08075 [Pseudohongiella sp.]|nr:hypothetical protein [Pseudohongiella sp.]
MDNAGKAPACANNLDDEKNNRRNTNQALAGPLSNLLFDDLVTLKRLRDATCRKITQKNHFKQALGTLP